VALPAAVVLAAAPLVTAAQAPAAQAPAAQTPAAQAPPAPAHAEQGLYVIEQLVVSVYGAPGSDGERVASLKSGDHVDVIERSGDDVHVRLSNGRNGWVRASYLTAAEPLRTQLAARSAEVTKLQAEVTRLEGELRAARTPPPVPQATTATGAAEPSQVRRPMLDAAPVIYRPRWRWLALSALLSLGAGFALGWWMLDRRIRAKYGGLRIY
jgi:Bacterial SH3 domain